MNAKRITARFRRGEAAAKPETGKPESAKPDAAAPEGAATEASSARSEAVTVEAAPAAASAPAEDSAKVAPARLVEGDRLDAGPKAAEGVPPRLWTPERIARIKPALMPAAAAVAAFCVLGIGYGIGLQGRPDQGSDILRVQGELGRVSAELKGITSAVEGLKGERERSRGEIVARTAQLSEKIDRLAQDAAGRSGRLAEQIDRMDKAQRDVAKVAGLSDRVEKLERTGAPTPPARPVAAATPAVPDVTQTGSLADPKPAADPRKTQIEGYFVRDFEEGFALIETKAGRYVEVAVGYTVPGIGRVEAIERRGRQWVVVTPKGYIGER